LIAVGSMTAPDRICAPISPAFSNSNTRKSSLPASFASCFNRMAALSPAGPVPIREGLRTRYSKLTSSHYTYIDLVALPINGFGVEALVNICEPPWDRNGECALLNWSSREARAGVDEACEASSGVLRGCSDGISPQQSPLQTCSD
jgi:hypothetical protein